ncbi:hypothetical protein PR048_013185 [Dryococelus australis]|uniref:DDE-1 domain-containing protein n=1 Tax=Dryococelus australis TaxID=614101 RepID=A0ABQ9HSB2_9NEOP|nr:hypothetical protein PR048_013185 [Dryococelus australis]
MGFTNACTFSDGWLTYFIYLHRIRKLDVSAKQKSADTEASDRFCSYIRLTNENELIVYKVYNWKCEPDITVDGGNKKHHMNSNKIRTHRVKLTVILKYAKSLCFKHTPKVSLPIFKENLWAIKNPVNRKFVLLLNNCHTHPPEKQLVKGNTFVVYLPPKLVGLIQPVGKG